jgi:hypothetical protein
LLLANVLRKRSRRNRLIPAYLPCFSLRFVEAFRKNDWRKTMEPSKGATYSISVRVSEFAIPPVTDGLVIGKDSPIGFSAIDKALNLLIANHHLESIVVGDDVISHIIVRKAILRRVPQEKLVAFALERLKPLMSATEVLHLDIKAEVTVEESGL